MRKPIKLTSAPVGSSFYRICDSEGVCHVVKGMRKVQRHIEHMPELLVTKMPLHWSAERTAVAVEFHACKVCVDT